jgi:hypothetical protein
MLPAACCLLLSIRALAHTVSVNVDMLQGYLHICKGSYPALKGINYTNSSFLLCTIALRAGQLWRSHHLLVGTAHCLSKLSSTILMLTSNRISVFSWLLLQTNSRLCIFQKPSLWSQSVARSGLPTAGPHGKRSRAFNEQCRPHFRLLA